MDHTGSPGGRADPSPQGPLSRADAESLLQRADGLLRGGDFADAAREYVRILSAPMGDPQAAQYDALLNDTGAAFARSDEASNLRGWWLYVMGRDHLGDPVVKLRAANRANLVKIKWPEMPR